MGNCISKKFAASTQFFKRIVNRELGPLLYVRETGETVREILPLQLWIENSIMYSKPLEFIDKTKFVRKRLKSENISSEHNNNTYASSKKIPAFVDFFHIKMSDFVLENPYDFATFNDFFIREVKSQKRPIAFPGNDDVITCAADSRLSVFDSIHEAHKLFIKGKHFSLQELLTGGIQDEDKQRAEELTSWVTEDLCMANFRLAPMDYHRFHSPVSGTITDLYHVPGEYFTTEPSALQSDVNVLGENARSIICIQTETHGRVLVIPIGAEAVGKVNLSVSEGDAVKKGDEIGYFDYGGSDVIAIFEHPVTWDADIYNQSHGSQAIETLIHVNEQIATFVSQQNALGKENIVSSSSSSSSSLSSSDDEEEKQKDIEGDETNHAAGVSDIE